MILSYFASRRRQRQAGYPGAGAHYPLSLAPGMATAAP